jgi:hypothetical protein
MAFHLATAWEISSTIETSATNKKKSQQQQQQKPNTMIYRERPRASMLNLFTLAADMCQLTSKLLLLRKLLGSQNATGRVRLDYAKAHVALLHMHKCHLLM